MITQDENTYKILNIYKYMYNYLNNNYILIKNEIDTDTYNLDDYLDTHYLYLVNENNKKRIDTLNKLDCEELYPLTASIHGKYVNMKYSASSNFLIITIRSFNKVTKNNQQLNFKVTYNDETNFNQELCLMITSDLQILVYKGGKYFPINVKLLFLFISSHNDFNYLFLKKLFIKIGGNFIKYDFFIDLKKWQKLFSNSRLSNTPSINISKVLMSNSRKEALQNLFPSYTIEKKVNTYNFFSSHYVCSTLKIYSIPSTKLIEVLNSVYPIKNIYQISNNTNEIAKNILLQYMQSKIFRYKRNKKFKPFYLNFITTHSTDAVISNKKELLEAYLTMSKVLNKPISLNISSYRTIVKKIKEMEAAFYYKHLKRMSWTFKSPKNSHYKILDIYFNNIGVRIKNSKEFAKMMTKVNLNMDDEFFDDGIDDIKNDLVAYYFVRVNGKNILLKILFEDSKFKLVDIASNINQQYINNKEIIFFTSLLKQANTLY